MEKKRNKILLICVMLVSCVFIGARVKVELVIDEPIVDLSVFDVDSVGSDATNPRPDAGNVQGDKENEVVDFYKPSSTVDDEVKNEVNIKVAGKRIFFNDALCRDINMFSDKISGGIIKNDSVVHLIDAYADSKIYKEVMRILSDNNISYSKIMIEDEE